MTVPAISVSRLTKIYRDAPAVDAISFDIPAGSVVGLLGGNGAGKTTTLSLLMGILLPTSGSISVMGIDMLKEPYRALQHMNFSSPYVDLPGRFTAKESLTFYSHLYNVPHYKDRIATLADELNLNGLMDRTYGSLSAGQKTRVSLAKSLINSPSVLLLDEPTASLDPDTADRVRQLLKNYQNQSKTTFLLASHNMQEVERMCDDVIIMKQGKIADRATPQALLEKYGRDTMEDVFLHIARRDEKDAA